MGPIFALRSRYLTLKNHISGYEKVLDFWKTDLLYWGHTVTFRPQLKKIWDYDFFAWYLHLQIYSKTFRQSVLKAFFLILFAFLQVHTGLFGHTKLMATAFRVIFLKRKQCQLHRFLTISNFNKSDLALWDIESFTTLLRGIQP